ncbi:putative PEP-CTERM system TPR-repeat lipoprotein [Paucibacter oligotrophus]|uniref:Putative PEP-CTERM system TPR-repeat lipoprotein n=1 Tax=Roseateles oligotrophus TaxID=1769250 RepID=A0A840LDH5_9BURK|nr:XrtA/PEP-CTERM system TPR-repeat protein PrsT [Roseateles oligotrophus]MBB4844119.1 putative PEP-CTERM system TPR-repeat lipoprotein [Roseateles oligotrophus]
MKTKNRALTPLLLALPLLFAACSGDSPEKLLSSAKQHIAEKDSKAAVIQLKNVLQKAPSNAEARFLLGKLLLDGGDFVGAEVELSKALEQGRPADDVVPLLAQAMLAQNKLEPLVVKFSDTKLGAPIANAELRASVAYAFAQLGKSEEARATLATAFESDAKNISAQILNIKMLMHQRNFEEVRIAIDKLLEQVPKNAEAWQLKGDFLLESSGATEAALAAYRESLKQADTSVLSHVAIIWTLLSKKDNAEAKQQLEAMKKALPNHPQTKFFIGLMALDGGDLKTAQEQSQFLLKVAPDNLRTLQLAGAVEFRKDSWAQAENYLTKFLKAAPASMQGQSRLMLAQIYLRGSESAKALAILQPLLDDKSQIPAAFSLAAEAELQRGESKAAESYFEKAVKLNPKDSRSRTALALAQVAKGDERGFDELRTISGSEKEITADLALVSALAGRKQWEKSLSAIDVIEKKQPTLPTADNLRGRVELGRGNRQVAVEAFERALKRDPKFYPAVASLANIDLADKKPELALKRFQEFLQADPKSIPAQLSVIELKARTGSGDADIIEALTQLIKNNPDELKPRLGLIRKQLDRGELKPALSAAQDGVAALPDQAEMLAILAQVEQLNGLSTQAAATLNKWASLQPNSPLPYTKLAELYIAEKDQAAAAQSLRRALAINEQFLPAQRLSISLDLAAGRIDAARQTVRVVQKQHAKDSLGLMLEGELEESQKNWAAATAAYRAAYTKTPSTDLAIKLHHALLASQKNAEAQALAAGLLKKSPNDMAFTYYLGDTALSQKNYEAAEGFYRAVLAIQPSNAAAMNNIAWLLNRAKNPEALQYAKKAVQLQPKQAALQDTLADIYATQGKFDQAIEVQKRALELEPSAHLHRLHLAKFYLSAGRKPEAKVELQKLADLGSAFPAQDEVRVLLAK